MPEIAPNPREATREIIKRAESFRLRHVKNPAVNLTYGYFTHHPVAPLNQKRLRVLLDVASRRSAELGRPLRVLDLACGGGLITCAFASLGHRVLGLDLNESEIGMAELFAREEKLEGSFQKADLLYDTEWERAAQQALGGKPDLVNLAYALHHLPDVPLFLRRLGQWLDTGAWLLVNEENPRSPLFRLKHRVRTWIQKDTDTEWHRSLPEWTRLIEEQGFRVNPQLTGLDPIPGLGRAAPRQCWSLVFTARRD